MKKTMLNWFGMVVVAVGLASCGGLPQEEPEVGSISSAVRGEACFVLCIQGYHQQPHTCTCVPDHGRDCTAQLLCVIGYHYDDTACRCLPDKPGKPETCGPTQCPAGQVCCNESCGICTEPDGACIQIACLPQ